LCGLQLRFRLMTKGNIAFFINSRNRDRDGEYRLIEVDSKRVFSLDGKGQGSYAFWTHGQRLSLSDPSRRINFFSNQSRYGHTNPYLFLLHSVSTNQNLFSAFAFTQEQLKTRANTNTSACNQQQYFSLTSNQHQPASSTFLSR